jgi:hypothetical protein
MRADAEWPRDELAERRIAAALNLAAKQIGGPGDAESEMRVSLQRMADGGGYEAPSRRHPLYVGVKAVQEFMIESRLQGWKCPQMLHRWMQEATDILLR